MKRRVWVLGGVGALLLAVALCGASGCRPQPRPIRPVPLNMTELTVGSRKVLAELAVTPRARQTGLMFRRELPEDTGMLFVFPDVEPRGFYMRNCLMDIDLAYLDLQGTIIDLHSMKVETSQSLQTDYKHYYSSQPVAYALEMEGGWFARHGLGVGDSVGPLPRLPPQ